MGQEFLINSLSLEQKINQLLPSQGGEGAGVDLSASTQIIPIVDLTETAEGSSLRVDLQTSLSKSGSFTQVQNATTTIFSTVGYVRVFGSVTFMLSDSAGTYNGRIQLNDGTSTFTLFQNNMITGVSAQSFFTVPIDFVTFLNSGVSLEAVSSNNFTIYNLHCNQIATLTGDLVDPT